VKWSRDQLLEFWDPPYLGKSWS